MTESEKETLNFFAAQAMNAILAKEEGKITKDLSTVIAKDSYKIAKAMLEESKKQK